jgi:hypothetical protein
MPDRLTDAYIDPKKPSSRGIDKYIKTMVNSCIYHIAMLLKVTSLCKDQVSGISQFFFHKKQASCLQC